MTGGSGFCEWIHFLDFAPQTWKHDALLHIDGKQKCLGVLLRNQHTWECWSRCAGQLFFLVNLMTLTEAAHCDTVNYLKCQNHSFVTPKRLTHCCAVAEISFYWFSTDFMCLRCKHAHLADPSQFTGYCNVWGTHRKWRTSNHWFAVLYKLMRIQIHWVVKGLSNSHIEGRFILFSTKWKCLNSGLLMITRQGCSYPLF